MVAATILLPEISILELQVQELQAQIAATQSRITVLGEADAVASGALQALQDAVQKISGLAPNALATLKAAALNLFQGGDNQGDDGGNPPQSPAPPSGLNGNGYKPEAVLGQDIVEISAAELAQYLERQATEIVPELNGQFSDLCCLFEDAPSTALTGQFVEIACTIPEAPQEQSYIKLVQLSQTLAYQRLYNGEIPAAYVAFKSKTRAEAWGRWLVGENNIAAGFEIRAAKRILGVKWEIKLWGISFNSIQRLGKINFNNAPSDQALNVWLEAAPPAVEELLTQQEDAISAPTPAEKDVEAQPTYPTIDPLDVPVGVSLRATDDYLLREYIVWATVIARDNGVPKPTQKAIGRLVEGNEIEAYRPRSGLCRTFTQTMDAVIHLISGAGYQMADLIAAQEMLEGMRKEEPSSPVVAPLQTIVEVIPDSVETPEVTVPDSAPVLTVGSRVEILSPRHGEQLVGQVGTVTAATPVGCVVLIGELTRWFCSDEVVIAEAPQVLVGAATGVEDVEF